MPTVGHSFDEPDVIFLDSDDDDDDGGGPEKADQDVGELSP
jgi:hypothetical protein